MYRRRNKAIVIKQSRFDYQFVIVLSATYKYVV